MNKLTEAIKNSKTFDELNSLRLLMVRDRVNFSENQKLFTKKMNQLKRLPYSKRQGQIAYNPEIKQRTLEEL